MMMAVCLRMILGGWREGDHCHRNTGAGGAKKKKDTFAERVGVDTLCTQVKTRAHHSVQVCPSISMMQKLHI